MKKNVITGMIVMTTVALLTVGCGAASQSQDESTQNLKTEETAPANAEEPAKDGTQPPQDGEEPPEKPEGDIPQGEKPEGEPPADDNVASQSSENEESEDTDTAE